MGEGIHHYTISGLVINIIFTIWIYIKIIYVFKYGVKIMKPPKALFMGLMLNKRSQKKFLENLDKYKVITIEC